MKRIMRIQNRAGLVAVAEEAVEQARWARNEWKEWEEYMRDCHRDREYREATIKAEMAREHYLDLLVLAKHLGRLAGIPTRI